MNTMIRPLYRVAIVITVLLAFLLAAACVKPPEPEPPAPEPTPEPANEQPVIHYLTAEKEVVPGAAVEIECVATDDDSDTLTYTWSAQDGDISGEGGTVTWTAPDAEGTYTIDVAVSDGKGGEASETIMIAVSVRPNNAPQVSLIVTYNGEEKEYSPEEPVRVKRYDLAQIEAVAVDPDGDELSYKWSSSQPRLEGMGSEVTFYAMETKDQVVTVTVVDSRGAETKMSVYFYVPCCGSQ